MTPKTHQHTFQQKLAGLFYMSKQRWGKINGGHITKGLIRHETCLCTKSDWHEGTGDGGAKTGMMGGGWVKKKEKETNQKGQSPSGLG